MAAGSKDCTRSSCRRSTIARDDDAVDDDGIDPDRRTTWFVERRPGPDARRIEQHEVRAEPFHDPPAIADPEALGGQAAHEVDRAFQADEPALPDVGPQDLRETAIAARVRHGPVVEPVTGDHERRVVQGPAQQGIEGVAADPAAEDQHGLR